MFKAIQFKVTDRLFADNKKVALSLALAVVAVTSSQALAQSGPRTQQTRLFSQTSIEKGWQRATQQQQTLLVMFTSDNCIYCKKMLSETYGHPAIAQLLATNTQTVLAHKDDYQALVKKLGIRGYPSSVLLSSKGEVLDFMEGYVPPKDFAQRVSPLLKAQATQARAASLPQQTAER